MRRTTTALRRGILAAAASSSALGIRGRIRRSCARCVLRDRQARLRDRRARAQTRARVRDRRPAALPLARQPAHADCHRRGGLGADGRQGGPSSERWRRSGRPLPGDAPEALLNNDPALPRSMGGIAIIIYLAMWLLVPKAASTSRPSWGMKELLPVAPGPTKKEANECDVKVEVVGHAAAHVRHQPVVRRRYSVLAGLTWLHSFGCGKPSRRLPSTA
jgi:hypothetical protein